jgi:cation diffusion facilitator CzcD-associated flavoprotein CzcO
MTQRPTPGNGYLERISDDKCDVTFSRIKEITENGLVTEDGTEHKLDVLICATGFDVSFRPRFPIVGENGVDMRDAFKDSPETYISVMAPNFPNYFSKQRTKTIVRLPGADDPNRPHL